MLQEKEYPQSLPEIIAMMYSTYPYSGIIR
jgi:hypothetical protein